MCVCVLVGYEFCFVCVRVRVAIGPVENIFSQSPCKLQLVRTRVDLNDIYLDMESGEGVTISSIAGTGGTVLGAICFF
jgi:tRNA A22 N-methylase